MHVGDVQVIAQQRDERNKYLAGGKIYKINQDEHDQQPNLIPRKRVGFFGHALSLFLAPPDLFMRDW